MQKSKIHFEQIPVAEVMKRIAEEEVEIDEKRPATATVDGPLGSTMKRVDGI